MADVIDIFSRQRLPVQEVVTSDFVNDFIENRYWDCVGALEGMAEATSEEEFIEWLDELRRLVAEEVEEVGVGDEGGEGPPREG